MKVTAVEAIPVAYPEPNDHDSTRHLLLVRVTTDDGAIGWGEAVTMWSEATDATAALVDGLASLVVGRDPAEHASVHAALTGRMSVEHALHEGSRTIDAILANEAAGDES